MKKMIWAVTGLLFLAVAGSGYADPIKVGAVTPLTGKLAVYGEGFQKAMLLAVDEVNAAGGVKGNPLEIVFEDNTSTSKGSVSAIRKLITVDKLPMIFGRRPAPTFWRSAPLPRTTRPSSSGRKARPRPLPSAGPMSSGYFPLICSRALAWLN